MLTDIDHVAVGHVSDVENRTGCTAILFEAATVGGVDVRGANPSTKDTDLMRPMSVMPVVHAIMLCGGSSFGLEAALGATRWLESKGRGFDVGVARIPIVPAAVIYDLSVGSPAVRPDLKMGWDACESATRNPFRRGAVGAGTGATVGKLFGVSNSSRGGLGTATVRARDVAISALMIVNSFGDVIDRHTGRILAGTRRPDGSFVDTYAMFKEKDPTNAAFRFTNTNTTIGVVCCDCKLTKEEANRIATVAHNGIARAIYPSHTSVDGDVIFATGHAESPNRLPVDVIGAAAAEAVELAIRDAVTQ